MEVTVSVWSLAIHGLMGAWVCLVVVASIALWFQQAKKLSDVSILVAEVRKYVMANKIDRAIKLCNNLQGVAIADAVVPLLRMANRPSELLRTEDEQIDALHLSLDFVRLDRLASAFGFANTLLVWGLVLRMEPTWPMVIMLLVMLLVPQWPRAHRFKMYRALPEHRHALRQVASMLLTRSERAAK